MVLLSLYRYCVLSALALSLLILVPPAAHADDAITPPKIDLSRTNDQPVYPDGAKDRNEQGDTVLAIDIDARGRLTNVTVEKTSGFDDLDQVAVQAARGWRYVEASNGNKDVPGSFKVTVHFQLHILPKTAFTENQVYALDDIGNMTICKRGAPAIGSNITPKPTCLTKREWDNMAEEAKRRNPRAMPALGTMSPITRPYQ